MYKRQVVGVSPTKIYAVVRARSVDESGETPISVTIGENEPYTFEQKFNYELTQMVSTLAGSGAEGQEAVSYTHLDVYKRQRLYRRMAGKCV